jgi:hypothetical protein
LLLFLLVTALRSARSKPTGNPTPLASVGQVSSHLLLEEAFGNPRHRPAGHYDYIMPEAQQRQIFTHMGIVRPGMAVDQVVKEFGPPLQNEWSSKVPYTRCLIYYFAVNLDRATHRPSENGDRARLVLLFNEQGVLSLIDSNVIDIVVSASEGPPFWRQLPNPATVPSPQ